MVNKEEAREELDKLIKRYNDHKDDKGFAGNEKQVCQSLIIPFINKVLGWETENPYEFKTEISQSGKRIDYTVLLEGVTQYIIEAKSLAVDIRDNEKFYNQAITYALNKERSYAILTNFNYFIILRADAKVERFEQAEIRRIDITNFSDTDFEFLWCFSKEKWFSEKGKSNLLIRTDIKKREKIDVELLNSMVMWRQSLLNNLSYNKNKNKFANFGDKEELAYIEEEIQRFIDRLVFICFCEDKELRDPQLKSFLLDKIQRHKDKEDFLIKKIKKIFEEYKDVYNSDLFDEGYCDRFYFDDNVLIKVLQDLRKPKDRLPYDFSSISVEILGKAYENFIGHLIYGKKRFKEEKSRKVRKEGGIYYTPPFIVEYIVDKTVKDYIKDMNFEQINKVKILDPACGSGSFLIKVFDVLVQESEKKLKRELTYKEKKQLITNCIFGVDLDERACDITKLSLSLKLAEKGERLPVLKNNIRNGDSLVDDKEVTKKALDYKNAFEDIFETGGFDIILGNPPYIKEYVSREPFELVKKTGLKKYYQGKMDIWYIFTCHSIDLLKDGGLHSFIAQNNWITSTGASIMRNKILTDTQIISFFDFNEFKVFEDAGIQTMIYVLKKRKQNKEYSVDYYKVIDKNISKEELSSYLITGKDGDKIEHFKAKISPQELINKTITFTNPKLNNILEKIKHKGNYYLKETDIAQGIVCPQEYVIDKHLGIIRDGSIRKGSGIFVLKTDEVDKLKLTQREKEIIKPFYTTEELWGYYGNQKNRLWIIYSDIEVRKNINLYPHIKSHLDKFKKIITSDFKPYGLHRARERRFFEGEKIISLRKTSKPCFTYTDFPCYVSQTYFVIKPKDINLKYLTGLLNSNIIHFWLRFKGKKQGDQLQIDKEPLLNIPLYKTETQTETRVINLVENLITLEKRLFKVGDKHTYESESIEKNIRKLKKEINSIFYDLYGINKEEREVIEKSLPIE